MKSEGDNVNEITNPVIFAAIIINIAAIIIPGIYMLIRVSIRRKGLIKTYHIIDETYPVHPKYRRFASTIENIYARQIELKAKVSELHQAVAGITDGEAAEEVRTKVEEIERLVAANVVQFPFNGLKRPVK